MYISKGALDIGVKYVVTEFHFHWGLDNKDEKKIESGHRLEGKKFPMEVSSIPFYFYFLKTYTCENKILRVFL